MYTVMISPIITMTSPASLRGRISLSSAGLPVILLFILGPRKQTIPPKTIMHMPSMEKNVMFGPVNIRLNMATIPFHIVFFKLYHISCHFSSVIFEKNNILPCKTYKIIV